MSIGTAPPPNHNLPFLSCRLNGSLISFLRSLLFAFIRSRAFLLEAYERCTTLPIAKRLQKNLGEIRNLFFNLISSSAWEWERENGSCVGIEILPISQ